jgi:ketosteroid isomerase-like protein
MAATDTLLDIVEAYLKAIEAGATGAELAAFFTPDVVQHELPNRLVPNGARRDLAAILEAAERGQQAVTGQRYAVRSVLAGETSVAMEVDWSATLKMAIGSLPVGGEMHAHFAMFLDFRDGKISSQRNYECFEPW